MISFGRWKMIYGDKIHHYRIQLQCHADWFSDILYFIRFDDFYKRWEKKYNFRRNDRIFAKNCKFYAASNQDTIDVQLLIYCERILWNFLKVDNSLKIIIE